MAYDDHRTQVWLDKNTAIQNRTEELADAYKLGERFEAIAASLAASGDSELLPHLLDSAINEWDLDIRDPEIDQNFREGSPAAAQIWEAGQ